MPLSHFDDQPRELIKCPFCKEWFNTTTVIIGRHIAIYHMDQLPPNIQRVVKVALELEKTMTALALIDIDRRRKR